MKGLSAGFGGTKAVTSHECHLLPLLQDALLPGVTKASVGEGLAARFGVDAGREFRGRHLAGWYLQQVLKKVHVYCLSSFRRLHQRQPLVLQTCWLALVAVAKRTKHVDGRAAKGAGSNQASVCSAAVSTAAFGSSAAGTLAALSGLGPGRDAAAAAVSSLKSSSECSLYSTMFGCSS